MRSDAPAASAGTPGTPGEKAAAGPRASALTWVGLAACAAFGAIAYRELLWFAPERSLAEELEGFFFIPSRTVAPLVVLLVAWLVYRRAGRLRALPAAGRAPRLAAALLASGAAIHLWATLTGAADLLVPSLALVGLGAAALWRGRAAVRVLAIPALFLLFAMPLPAPVQGEVVFWLQITTADLTGVLLTLLRVPHHVAGEQILRTEQTFSVIETCSGLRSIETLTMVAILMADLFRRPLWHTAVLVLAAAPLALLLNGGRAVALILNPHSELASIHNLQGVAILLGGLLLLFALDGLLERADRRARPRAVRGCWDGPSAASPGDPRRLLAVGATLAALAAAGAALPRFPTSLPEPLRLSERLAVGIGDLFSHELETDRVFLGSAGFRDSVTRRFTRGDHPVDVFLGVGWRRGRARSALSPKTALPGSGWIAEQEQRRRLPPDGREVRSLIYRSGTQTLLVYHWVEGSYGLVIEAMRALAALDASPLRVRQEMVVVRLATDVGSPLAEGLGPAEARLDSFYAELRPGLDALPRQVQEIDGNAFLDFPARENSFSERTPRKFNRISLIQALGPSRGLGTTLAKPRPRDGDAWEPDPGARVRG